ncbi:hypothetical protein HNP71_001889 [Acidocella aromatica]|uniref:AsnC family protein n=1 Tax=Acidocella aromatica TaxID=1303579 RepID=A0A840VKC7_9PROT|nr:hypothetical protein [Acidocella aromatica]
MPQARQWTAIADQTICEMRAAGETWSAIGRRLGLARSTVIERGRRLRASAPVKSLMLPKRDDMLDDPNRPPLPAGHPLTWSLLTDEPFPEGDEA